MKKILAIVLALAMVMALAISVSAADVIKEGDINFTVSNDWWEEIPTDEVFTAAEVNDVSKIVFTAEGEGIIVVYSNLDGAWTQTPEKVNEFTVDFADVTKDVNTDADGNTSPYVKLFASITAGTEINVHYVVYGVDGAAAPVEDGTAADNNTVEPAAPADNAAPAPAATTTTSEAPKTGLALAVVPAVMALAAVAVSKKH